MPGDTFTADDFGKLPKAQREVLAQICMNNDLGHHPKTIKALLDQTEPGGSGSILWDGTDNTGQPVPSGVYIYKIQAGPLVLAKKMILLR